MGVYNPGQLVRLSVTFTVAGVNTDPTTVTCKVKTPDGTTTTQTYNPGNIVRDGTGQYHYDLAAVEKGYTYYGFYGTGTCSAAEEGVLTVVSNIV